MNNKLKLSVASVVISVSLLGTGYSASAADAVVTSTAAVATYKLTDLLDVEVKGVLNERVDGGTRIGVIVRMKNNGNAITRVPEYELRVRTNDGIEYTLQGSAANAKSIQPKATTELSYMATIDRTDEVVLSQVNWTDVDYYVYPKKETLIVGVPIQGAAWKGSDTTITDPAALKKWSESFTIPGLISPLQYTPVALNKEFTDKGTVIVIQLLAYNPTDKRETIPAFTIDGKSASKVYAGSRAETGSLVLEPKEEKYIHYAIPVDQDTTLESINVLTQESFAQAGGVTKFNVGRLNILLPTNQFAAGAAPYTLGTPIVFDKLSELIHPDMNVSVVEFTMSENEDAGSKNVTAKFKLTNKSSKPIALPVFQADLVSSDGYEYAGNRQNVVSRTVLPNSSMTVSYSFTVPFSENGRGLVLKVQDAQTAAPYKSTIAVVSPELQAPVKNQFSLYPFNVKVKNWSLVSDYGPATQYRYAYRIKLDLDIQRDEQVQLDPSFSNLYFELYDSTDRFIGSATGSLFGTGRLVNKDNNITINGTAENFDTKMKIKIYETFQTPAGLSKRLLAELKQ